MLNLIDKIIIDVLFLATFSLSTYYIFEKSYIFIPLTIVTFILFKCGYLHALNRRRNKKELPLNDILFCLSMMDKTEQRDYFLKTLPKESYTITGDNSFIYDGKAYATLVKFGSPSVDDFCKLSKKHNEIYVLSRKIARDTLLIAKKMGVYVHQIPLKKMRKYLITHNAMPTMPKPTKQREKLHIKAMIQDIITRKRAKYYLFSALTMLFLSFFVPYTIYYLVSAIVFSVLTIGSMFSTN